MSWCWHKYPKWKDCGKSQDFHEVDGKKYIDATWLIQKRECTKCGKKKYRRERIA